MLAAIDPLPPCRSIQRPTRGAQVPAISNDMVNAPSNANNVSLVPLTIRDVVGENKKSPMVSFYAAGIGVMFLLFTASAAGGSLLDESDSGALDRVLSSHVSMTTLLAGKMIYCTLLAFSQLCLMFLWGWAV